MSSKASAWIRQSAICSFIFNPSFSFSAAASKFNNYPFSPLHVSLLLKSCTCTMSVQTKNTSLFRKHLSATQKHFNIDSIRFPGKCKHFLACSAKNTVVIRYCITVCDLFFYVSYCGISFVSWNFLLNKKVPSALYSADRTFLYGLCTSQEHYSHIILMGIFSTVTPSSVSRSYTDTGSRSLPGQM